EAGARSELQALDLCRSGKRRVGSRRERESRLRDRGDAGKAPLLLFHRREAELGEPGDRALADLPEPGGGARGAIARERLEVADVVLGHATGAGSRVQS